MHRLPRLILLVALAVPALPDARAEPAPTAEAPAEVITVTSLRLPRPARDEPAAVTVVERREIDRTPAVLFDDLLRTLPSVGTFRRSSSAIADPTSQGLNLRGIGPSAVSRALVLRDGIPANDPFGGWMYWRSVSPLSVERIEVTPSGASALFGNFALGGVVDISSRPPSVESVDLVLAAGSLETLRAAGRVSHTLGPVAVAVDGELFRTRGYTPIAAAQRGAVDGRAGSSHGTATARAELVRATSSLHAAGTYFSQALDAGTQDTTADVRAVTYNVGGGVTTSRGSGRVELFGGAQRFTQDRARVAAGRASAALSSHQVTPSNDQGALATWTFASTHHQLLVGADARRVRGHATDELHPAMVTEASLVERTAGGEQRFAGAFVQDAISLGETVELAGAVRLDTWTNTAASTQLTYGDGSRDAMKLAGTSAVQLDPRLGVLVHLSPVVAMRASGYRSFRAPTLNELYRPFQVGTVLTAANPDLGPETAWGAEVGPQITLPTVAVRATAFWNRLDDAVANVTLPVPLPSGATRQRQNLGRARIAGLELEASWRPSPAWTAMVAHTFVDSEVISAPAAPSLVGKGLPQDPKLRTTATLTYDDLRYATVTLQVRYLGRMFEDDLQTLPIGAVVLCDVRVARVVGRGVSAFVSVQNAFDRRYLVGRAGIDTEGAPRMLEVGLAFHR